MNNSQNAITVIYREHWQKLYIHAYNLLNDEESAKDVVNDVFCSVLESNEPVDNGRGSAAVILRHGAKSLY